MTNNCLMTLTRPTPASPLKIGTRGSPLALAQAHETRARLMAAFDLPEEAFAIVVIKVTGDAIQDRPLKEIGGKGLFTREIEEALLDGSIDIAVHSMKDMPVLQPAGLLLDTYLPREDVRDAFVAQDAATLKDLPEGARVGSSSLRRRAQLLNAFPHLEVVEFRGNVQTRLKKLADGVASATFLAQAGLNRLGMAHVARGAISPDDRVRSGSSGAPTTPTPPPCSRQFITSKPASALPPSALSLPRSTGPARRRLPGWRNWTALPCACAARSCVPTGRKRSPMTAAARFPTRPRWRGTWRKPCSSRQAPGFSTGADPRPSFLLAPNIPAGGADVSLAAPYRGSGCPSGPVPP